MDLGSLQVQEAEHCEICCSKLTEGPESIPSRIFCKVNAYHVLCKPCAVEVLRPCPICVVKLGRRAGLGPSIAALSTVTEAEPVAAPPSTAHTAVEDIFEIIVQQRGQDIQDDEGNAHNNHLHHVDENQP